MPSRPFVLQPLEMGQHLAEMLVLGDHGVDDTLPMVVEATAGLDDALVLDLAAAVEKFVGIGVVAY